jgi:hypothetical protein
MVKNCASRWSFTKNHNMMHGQQNVKILKVSMLLIKMSITHIYDMQRDVCLPGTNDRTPYAVFQPSGSANLT